MDDDFLRDLFDGLGPIAIRRLFGGKAVSAGGLTVALIAFETVFLKADGETEAEFEAAGARPFTYRRGAKLVTIKSYWSLPEPAFDDPDEASRWVRLALAAARRKGPPRARARSGRRTAPRDAVGV
jgi:DNA transformation protein and related proteins